MRPIALLVPVAIFAAGCLDNGERESPHVVGSALDAHVAAGSYAGYRVIRPCPTRVAVGAPLAVKGSGESKLTTSDELAAWSARRLAPLARAGTSIHSFSDYGLGCEDTVGTSITLSDWREVDALVEKLGTYMREDGVDVEVSISVETIPVPVAD